MGAVIDGYPTDLSIREEFEFPGEATRFPVETGADFADHIRDLPEEITLECLVSDTPSGAIATDPTRQTDGAATPLPSADALLKLREMKAARRPVTIQTTLGTFENMACVGISVPKDKDRDGGLFFTARFQRVEIKTNKRTRVRTRSEMAGAGGKAKPQRKAVETAVVRRRILWRVADVPGGPLRYGPADENGTRKVLSPWAIVEAVRQTIALSPGSKSFIEGSTGNTAPETTTTDVIYRYTGEADPRLRGDANLKGAGGIRPNEELTPAATAAFLADWERDKREDRAAGLRDLLSEPAARERRLISDPRNAKRGLPPGIKTSRITRPAPPSIRGR